MIPISCPSITDAERRAVLAVLDSGTLAQGPLTAMLEERVAALVGVRHCVATSSGTAALHLALLAHGIGPGDEVVTTPFSFVATVNAILLVGATPVFADIDPATYNIDPSGVEALVTARTRAILVAHLYGQACDIGPLAELAQRRGLVLIEDACQALGATYRGRPVGSFGTGVFSLYATKNIAAGEGGLITTNDDAVAERCRMLRSHGMRDRYQYELLGYNYRMSDIHAAIALAQLDRADTLIGRRAANAAWFSERIETVDTPQVAPGRSHVWHQYTVRVRDGLNRDDAVARLAESGVGTGVFYPVPLHLIPHVRAAAGPVSLPRAEAAAAEVFSLPVHPSLTRGQRDSIVRAVNALR